MKNIQKLSRVLMVYPTSTTNAATAAGYVDRLGYDDLAISVLMTTADAVSNKPATLRILESDATQPTASSNYATITGFVSGTDYTIPSAISVATNITQPFAVFNVDCRARKRYIRVEVSPVTTQIIAVTADLGRAETQALTTAQATVVITG